MLQDTATKSKTACTGMYKDQKGVERKPAIKRKNTSSNINVSHAMKRVTLLANVPTSAHFARSLATKRPNVLNVIAQSANRMVTTPKSATLVKKMLKLTLFMKKPVVMKPFFTSMKRKLRTKKRDLEQPDTF